MSRCCDCCEEGVDSYSIDDLLNEINARINMAIKGYVSKFGLIALDDLNLIRRAIRRGDLSEEEYLFESAILPKWEHLEQARKAWLKAIAAPPPPPKCGLWWYLENTH